MRTISLPNERIERKILFMRGRKIMLDSDLAELYGVETKVLNQAVRRNRKRFPADFMFQLNQHEMRIWEIYLSNNSLRSQFVTLKTGRGQHRKYRPFAFTEHGVAMLSSVLNNERAIHVNIHIIRTFTKLREILSTHKQLKEKIEKLEGRYDEKFRVIFDVIKKLLREEEKPKREIGFKVT